MLARTTVWQINRSRRHHSGLITYSRGPPHFLLATRLVAQSPRKDDKWFCECGFESKTCDTGCVFPAFLHSGLRYSAFLADGLFAKNRRAFYRPALERHQDGCLPAPGGEPDETPIPCSDSPALENRLAANSPRDRIGRPGKRGKGRQKKHGGSASRGRVAGHIKSTSGSRIRESSWWPEKLRNGCSAKMRSALI
jgi:hypothetical protein